MDLVRSPSDEGSVQLDLVIDAWGADAEPDVDLDLPPEPSGEPLVANRVGPLLDIGGHLRCIARAEGGGHVDDYIALSAAWNSMQHQLGNHVEDISRHPKGRPYHPSTTSLLSILQMAFAKKEPRRSSPYMGARVRVGGARWE